MMKRVKDERGFTFLEVTFVLAIIGFFMMVGIPNYKAVAERAQEKSCEANRKLIEAQLESYYIDHHSFPGTDVLDTLVKDKYLKEKPACPSKSGQYTISTSPIKVTCSIHEHPTEPTTP